MLIKIAQETIDKCTAFAQECAQTNKYYASRGQANLDKIVQDIITGKLGEFAAYELLSSKFSDTTLPDLEIYRGGRKSHSADLTAGGHNFSVKTQSFESIKRYGVSWLMEKSSLPKFEGHYVILCVQLENNCILIQNVVQFSDMLAVQAEPRLKHLKSKCAFYYNDMMLKDIP
jgi:hypothetical protein